MPLPNQNPTITNSTKATYDLEQIHTIINTSTVVHVSFNTPDPSNPFPITLPMVGFAASFDHPSASLAEPLDIYLHGYVSSRLMNLSRNGEKNPSTTPETGTDTEPPHEGLPVTVSATLVDGLILTLTPNSHDVNYRSACVYGYAAVVASTEEKLWAMQQITDSVVPDRWRHTRVPPDSAEMQSTSILRVSVVGGSGKIRVGGPRDDNKDYADKEMRERVWTGVIPVWETMGAPVGYGGVVEGDESRNMAGEVPEHVSSFARRYTEEREKYAMAALGDRSQD